MAKRLKIAAVQISVMRGDVEHNIQVHESAIKVAAKERIDILIFPELSLTGYEPELASDLVFSLNDKRLEPLQRAADEYNMMIIAGAPLYVVDKKPAIASIIMRPHLTPISYSKQCFHSGEDEYFSLGSKQAKVIHFRNVCFGLSICADMTDGDHAAKLAKEGAEIYLASVLITANGYDADINYLKEYAQTYGMVVVMANYYGVSGGYVTTGRSAIWNNAGELLAEAPKSSACLVIYDTCECTGAVKLCE